MRELYWMNEAQYEKIKRHLPYSHGVKRVDDIRVLSGIIFVLKRGLQWRDAPKEYGPHKPVTAFALSDRQTFLGIEPIDLLQINLDPIAFK